MKLTEKHPRLRGEDKVEEQKASPPTETPPLTRGRRSSRTAKGGFRRNTPAYAGKTSGAKSTRKEFAETPPLTRGRLRHSGGGAPFSQKHPRLRGEDLSGRERKRKVLETPPLTRGRPPFRALGYVLLGNTPAYAGKTSPSILGALNRGKHPRLRGEDRGKRPRREHGPGNTPAYAGKTDRHEIFVDLTQKHPRLRGEDQADDVERLPQLETPPLTRGRQQHFVRRQTSQYKIRCY